MPRNRSESATHRAREARRKPSVAEGIFWQIVRNERLGFKFRREHPVGPYRLDFFCGEAMIAVELDGEQHQVERDQVRDAQLVALGISTFRISNRSFFDIKAEGSGDEILELVRLCEERSGRKAFGEGERPRLRLGRPLTPNPSPPEGRGEPEDASSPLPSEAEGLGGRRS